MDRVQNTSDDYENKMSPIVIIEFSPTQTIMNISVGNATALAKSGRSALPEDDIVQAERLLYHKGNLP